MPELAQDPLPDPGPSRWGRTAATVYLAVALLAFAGMLMDLAAGHSGFGTWVLSVITAPWSVLLASLARALAPRLAPAALRAIGLALAVLAALLNALIVHGIAARAERDAAASRSARG